jgi:ASC-1-like (ASCH) protein
MICSGEPAIWMQGEVNARAPNALTARRSPGYYYADVSRRARLKSFRRPEDASADRLFVPLAAEPFRWFCSGKKLWELRKLGRQYTHAHVRLGRDVELRRGYSDPHAALRGEIVDVREAPSVKAFFEAVPWEIVLPESVSIESAIAETIRILNIDDPERTAVLGFRVAISR